MLYVICYMLYVVGSASWAELMPSWGYMLSTLGLLGSTLGLSTVKLSIPSDFGSGLAPIDGTMFEANRPWQNPFSHGYRVIKHNTRD